MTGGLSVNYTSNSQLTEIDKARQKLKSDQTVEAIDTGLGAFIRKQWERNRRAKHEINYRLLNCLRARKGEYSIVEMQKILAYGAADPVYLKLTGTKCRAASSWIRDILLSPKHGEKPWSIRPGPIPHLPDDMEQAITENQLPLGLQNLAMQGVTLNDEEMWKFKNQIKQNVLEEMKKIAEKACTNLELKVEDMLEKGKWKEALEEFIEDFVTYPFAVIKGPYYQRKIVLDWKDGKAVPKLEMHLCYRRVSPFDIFYSPYCKNIQEGNLIERLRYTPETLYELIGVEGFREDKIRNVLDLHKTNNLRNWIWEDFERDYLENNSPYFLSDHDTIDGLHFWGHAKGEDIIAWGYKGKEIKDPQKMYPIEAILIGQNVIRCEINNNPMGWRPYHSSTWDKVPGSLVGVALPEQMEDHQRIVNATCRSLMTNLSIGSGPQAVILTDMLAEGENITNIFPMKIWQMKSSITGNSGKPVEFFQPETNADELMQIINTFEQKTDDVTNVPRYSYGNEKIGGAGQTATGLSMLMNSAAKGIRRAIGNIDAGVIKPVVTQTFTEILETDPDETIKGDIDVVSDGSSAVLIREQLQTNQKEFLQIVSTPMGMQAMGIKGYAKLLKDIADEMGLKTLGLPTDAELEQMEATQKQQQQEMHKATVADLQGQSDGQQAQAQAQQAAQELQQKAQELDQVAQQQQQADASIKQEQAQAAAQSQMVKKQGSAVDAEMKRLSALKQSVDEQLQQIATAQAQFNAEQEQARIQANAEFQKQRAALEEQRLKFQTEQVTSKAKDEIEHEKKMLELEKASINIEAAGNKIKAAAVDVKSQVADAKEEKKGKDKEAKSDDKTDKAIAEALKQVAESLKVANGPKKIKVERDAEGKIQGATATPSKSGGLETK